MLVGLLVISISQQCSRLRGEDFVVTQSLTHTHALSSGMVYNVTPYMDYHPGGEEELMKAAGIDGTDLFDQVCVVC